MFGTLPNGVDNTIGTLTIFRPLYWVLSMNYLNLCFNLLIGFSKYVNENQQKPSSSINFRTKKRILISTFKVGILAIKAEFLAKALKVRFQTQGIML
jgi:hypothetical protein